MAECAGIANPGRVLQLILRHPKTGADLIVLDILPEEAQGAEGFQGITVGEGFEGLYRVPVTVPVRSTSYSEGEELSRWPRKDGRRPKVTFHAQAGDGPTYEDVETLLWTVLSTKWDCWLRVFGLDGVTWRELKVRLFKEPNDSVSVFHGVKTHGEWVCELVAADPFWYSTPFEFAFTRDDMTPVAGGYEIDIPVTNPTDNLGWLEWNSGELEAAETWSLSDGYDGPMVPLPELLPAATKAFWVNTYPSAWQLFTKNPAGDINQQWARMRGRYFTKPLPANTPGGGTVRARLVGGTPESSMLVTVTRRWDRPFGGELPVAAQMVEEAHL